MKLLWIPADLPTFPVTEKLLAIIRQEQFFVWSFARLTEQQESPYDVTVWNSTTRQEFPEIIEWFKNLPAKSIRNVKFNMQHSVVPPHVDFTRPEENMDLWANNSENDPCGYRVLVRGKQEDALYVIDSHGNKTYCVMPPDTNTYILRHSDGIHGVNEDIDRLVIFMHIEIDSEKHATILASSLDKYGKYAIYDSDPNIL